MQNSLLIDAIALLDELRLTLADLPEGMVQPASWVALGALEGRLCRIEERAA